jgi:hypothetical protein
MRKREPGINDRFILCFLKTGNDSGQINVVFDSPSPSVEITDNDSCGQKNRGRHHRVGVQVKRKDDTADHGKDRGLRLCRFLWLPRNPANGSVQSLNVSMNIT